MNEKNTKKAYGWISKTIIEVLSNDVVDGESLATFSIYLKFGVLKAYCPDIITAKKIIPGFLNTGLAELEPAMEEELKSSFEDNSELLIDICKEVWNNSYYQEVAWLEEWETICKDILEEEQEKKQICNSLLKVVNEQLEISEKASFVMQSMINRTFELVNRLPSRAIV